MGELIEYKVVREYLDGRRGKRNKTLYRWDDNEQLTIGGLYVHLGPGYPGMQRVLSARRTGDKTDEKNARSDPGASCYTYVISLL